MWLAIGGDRCPAPIRVAAPHIRQRYLSVTSVGRRIRRRAVQTLLLHPCVCRLRTVCGGYHRTLPMAYVEIHVELSMREIKENTKYLVLKKKIGK